MSGVLRKVERWDTEGMCLDKRDPSFGWAMAFLSCGHRAAVCYLSLKKRGKEGDPVRCVACLPRWLVHVREDERLAKRRARRFTDEVGRRRIVRRRKGKGSAA